MCYVRQIHIFTDRGACGPSQYPSTSMPVTPRRVKEMPNKQSTGTDSRFHKCTNRASLSTRSYHAAHVVRVVGNKQYEQLLLFEVVN